MKFYSIIKSSSNEIVNRYTNLNLMLKNIINYTDPNIKHTFILFFNKSYIHLDLDKILSKNNFLNLTIRTLFEILKTDKFVNFYKCTDEHPHIQKCLYTFDLGDVIDVSKVEFYNPTNMLYTPSVMDELAIDLSISISGRDNRKIIPIFDNKIYWNKGNTNHVIFDNLRNVIIDEYHGNIPIDKIHFIDLNPFEDNVDMINLSNFDTELIQNSSGVNTHLIIKNIPDHTSLYNFKGILLFLDGKYVPLKLFKYKDNNIIVNLNLLKRLKPFANIEDNINSINSFIVLFKNRIYAEYFSDINDVLLYNSKMNSTIDIPLNSLLVLDTRNYGFIPHTVMKSKLEDINMNVVFDETYEDYRPVSQLIVNDYRKNIYRYELMMNSYEDPEDNLVPLYEDLEVYQWKNVNMVDRVNYLIPMRFVFSHG